MMPNKHKQQTTLYKDFQYSIILHVAILGAFSLKAFFFSDDSIDYKSAVRVDIIDLPDKIVNKPKISPSQPEKPTPAKPTPAPKPVAKKPPPKKPTKSVDLKAKQSSAIDRMKALERLKKEEELKDTQSAALNKIKEFKGNTLSKGSSLDGLVSDQVNVYIGELDAYIKQHWSLPRWLSEEALTASVLVRIDSRGFVIFRKISKGSSNPDYDDYALKAIDAASPFPAPPANLASTLEYKGVTIEFDNREI